MGCKGIVFNRVGYEQSGVGNGQGVRRGWVCTDFLFLGVCFFFLLFLAVLLS